MKYFAFPLLLLVSISVFGQSNDAFTHRATLIGADGKPFSMKTYEAEVNILEDLVSPDVVTYAETHSIKTDSLGWYAIKIGSGKVVSINNKFSDIDWSSGSKFLNVKVVDSTGVTVANGITEILTSPQVLLSKSMESRALLTWDCLSNLDALRNFPVPEDGEVICIKGHTSVRDGGEGFFTFRSDLMEDDNDGIVIRPKSIYSDKPGRWIRNMDGPINVQYFGVVSGSTTDQTAEKIQRAIDYAANNKWDDHNNKNERSQVTKYNTVFFPNGNYVLDKSLVIKDGIALRGEGFNTFLSASRQSDLDYILKMDKGRIICHVEKMVLNGGSVAGGIFLEARFDPEDGLGGISRSTFRDIEILNIGRHGLVLEAENLGHGVLAVDNQFNVFENIHIRRKNKSAEFNSMLIRGAATQNVFIECIFEGDRANQPTMAPSVLLENIVNEDGKILGRSAGLSFVNCGFGLAHYGIVMRGSENITLDTCWFENVHTSITTESAIGINVLACRFANACGYGSQPPNGVFIPNGHCIVSENSSMNVEKNFVLISNINETRAYDSRFILGRETIEDSINIGNTNTISVRDNHFRDDRLSRTEGVLRSIPVESRTLRLDGNNQVAADFNRKSVLRYLQSNLGGGEKVELLIDRPNGNGQVKLKDWDGNSRKGNISLNGEKQIVLNHGQRVTFIKVDAPLSNNGIDPIYVLLSVAED